MKTPTEIKKELSLLETVERSKRSADEAYQAETRRLRSLIQELQYQLRAHSDEQVTKLTTEVNELKGRLVVAQKEHEDGLKVFKHYVAERRRLLDAAGMGSFLYHSQGSKSEMDRVIDLLAELMKEREQLRQLLSKEVAA